MARAWSVTVPERQRQQAAWAFIKAAINEYIEIFARASAQPVHVTPPVIALAYVLCQPFPTFALFGPRALAETRTSLPALDIALTPEELRWLNLEE